MLEGLVCWNGQRERDKGPTQAGFADAFRVHAKGTQVNQSLVARETSTTASIDRQHEA